MTVSMQRIEVIMLVQPKGLRNITIYCVLSGLGACQTHMKCELHSGYMVEAHKGSPVMVS